MHICFFIKSFFGGGAERVVVSLANELVTNCDVTILVADESGPYRKMLSEKVNVVHFSKPSIARVLFELSNIQKKYQFDYLVSNLSHENIFSSIGCLFIPKLKLIKVEHNNLEYELNTTKGTFKKFVTKVLWQLTKNIGSITIGVSSGVADDLKSKGVKRTTYIHNPIELRKYEFMERRNFKQILFVGRFEEQKDPMLALRVFKRLYSIDNEYSLVMLGDGLLKQSALRYCKANNLEHKVTFCGFVDNVSDYYKNSGFLLMPSKWEGFGNVIIEAAWHGCIPVVADVDYGPREIIEDNTFGWLIKDRNKIESYVERITAERQPFNLELVMEKFSSNFASLRAAQKYKELVISL